VVEWRGVRVFRVLTVCRVLVLCARRLSVASLAVSVHCAVEVSQG
jgi:hypothetical protein